MAECSGKSAVVVKAVWQGQERRRFLPGARLSPNEAICQLSRALRFAVLNHSRHIDKIGFGHSKRDQDRDTSDIGARQDEDSPEEERGDSNFRSP